ncbi:MAG: isochorismate synthase [Gemmatimonadaceae bacterium]
MTVDTSLDLLVARASASARAKRHRVLVSAVERVPSIDPLEAIVAAQEAATRDPALGALIDIRSYWTRPADGFALAGLGSAVTFAPDGSDRFTMIDRGWKELLADAVIADQSSGVPGAGPTLIGGFAFDPKRPATPTWGGFPQARLTVPLIQLVERGGACWLTTSLVVNADGETGIDLSLLARLRAAVLAAQPCSSESQPSITNADAVAYDESRNANEWRGTVRAAVARIREGDLEKVVLAREVHAETAQDFDTTETIRQLRYAHPTCYVFGFWSGDSAFVGATPERLVRVDGQDVQASSLAGSTRRGATPADDAAQAQELFASDKDRSEHEIVRRALCTGLARFCDNVTSADMPTLLSLPQVHHLHTAVRARLRPGHTILQLVEELHPTPAVGGAPKEAALQFIRENEEMDRGWYAAPIGWLQSDRGEFAVALRSAVITGPNAWLFAGCGVVRDSDPNQEYAESMLKLRPVQTALAAAVAVADVDSAIAEATAYSGDTQ